MEQQLFKKKSRNVLFGKVIFGIGMAIIICCLGFILGYATPKTISPNALPGAIKTLTNSFQQQGSINFNVFEEVWNSVQTQHVNGKPNESDLYYGMLKGLVAGLNDPYSVFLDPKETEAFTSDLSGTFEGIGAEIGLKNSQITIISPLANSPAEKAGLRANDIVLSIDGKSTAQMNLDTAIGNIRGKKGTTVKLLIKRDGEDQKEYTIVRDTIKTSAVTYKIKDSTAIITLSSFSQDSAKEFDDAVNAVALKNPASIVLDLRNNPGGLLDASVSIAGVFLPKDSLVVIEQSSDGKREELKTTRNGRFLDLPLVVLINNGSASASEILAGALRDHHRATLIGETTFGKGTVQTFDVLSDGSSLKLTTAKWLTPDGASFNEKGITPDTIVQMTEDDYTKGKDPQLDAAIKQLAK